MNLIYCTLDSRGEQQEMRLYHQDLFCDHIHYCCCRTHSLTPPRPTLSRRPLALLIIIVETGHFSKVWRQENKWLCSANPSIILCLFCCMKRFNCSAVANQLRSQSLLKYAAPNNVGHEYLFMSAAMNCWERRIFSAQMFGVALTTRFLSNCPFGS